MIALEVVSLKGLKRTAGLQWIKHIQTYPAGGPTAMDRSTFIMICNITKGCNRLTVCQTGICDTQQISSWLYVSMSSSLDHIFLVKQFHSKNVKNKISISRVLVRFTNIFGTILLHHLSPSHKLLICSVLAHSLSCKKHAHQNQWNLQV